MLVRFLAAVSLLVALAVLPALFRAQSVAGGATTVVSLPVPRIHEDPDTDELAAALSSPDPRRALLTAACLVSRECGNLALRIDPSYPARLLKAIADRRLERHHALAGFVLTRFGDAARTAALSLRLSADEREREVSRIALEMLNADPAVSFAQWKSLSRIEW